MGCWLAVSRAGYCAWRRSSASDKSVPCRLTAAVKRVFAEHKGRYGSPRVHAQLAREGLCVGKRRVERLMREHGLVGRTRRRIARTTVADPNAAPAPNILGRDFSTTGPNQKWVTDLTYVETTEGFIYLALLQDLFSGRVVGWAMDDHMETDLCLRALQMAVDLRKPLPGLIHHSDRGSQYTSHAYRAAIEAQGMICSMSRKAQSWDKAHARKDIAAYLQTYYNAKRIKKRLGYSSPIDYELRHGLMTLVA